MKVFGIGLSKTGTTSLAKALEILGYRVKDYPGLKRYVANDLSTIDAKLLDEYEALTDTPIPSLYRQLDAKYPGSKFILTVRDREGWLKSCKRQFTERLDKKQNEAHRALFRELYDCSVFEEEKFSSGYSRFVDGVLRHFDQRPNDLLVLDIGAGEGWEKLCPFLDKAVPDVPFPKANVTKIRWISPERLMGIARHAGVELVAASRVRVDSRKGFFFGSGVECSRTGLFFRWTRYALSRDRWEAAEKRSLRLIKRELQALNPDIPIVSPLDREVSYEERRRWNHFWLIDPLQNRAGLASGRGDCAISIALIEDRKPIVGVVYAPLRDAIGYTMPGKGAYISAGLAPSVQTGPPRVLTPGSNNGAGDEFPMGGTSKALSICALAGRPRGTRLKVEKSFEWETAAAQAIIEALELPVKVRSTGAVLRYNKANLENGPIIVG